MKKNKSTKPDPSLTALHKTETNENEFMFPIPQGVKFNDIYMDFQEVAIELEASKRSITNYRKAGILSYTSLYKGGRILYLRQEFAAMIKANMVFGKQSILPRQGSKSLITAFESMVSLLPDWACLIT